jgi:hypothetical protein
MSDELDVRHDTDTGLSYVDVLGDRRLMGCLPPKENDLPRFSAGPKMAVIPRSQWKPHDLTPYFAGIDDQNGHGACVGFGSEGAANTSKGVAGGVKRKLSPWFVYAGINGGSDSGAVVSDACTFMRDVGTCLDETVPDKAWHKRMIPREAYEEAKRFRIHQAYGCDTFDEIVSAILLNFSVSFGISIGNRFTPNANGILPDWDGRNVGGHCMQALGVVLINGKWYLKVPNSWSTRWGLNGFCFMPESYFSGQRYGVDAWALQSLASDPMEPGVAVA